MAIKPVGILALQGNFAQHAQAVVQAGGSYQWIRKPQELQRVSGLILPGGESTVILKHFELEPAWWEALSEFHQLNRPLFGTCAGLIILANTVIPAQRSLGFLEVTVERNAYGRQLDSHWADVRCQLNEDNIFFKAPLIRAPKIISFAPTVTPIAWADETVIMVRQGPVLGATFHPEVSTSRVHRYFLEQL